MYIGGEKRQELAGESEIWGCLTVPLRVLFPVFGPSDLELPARGWGTNLCELTDAVL